MRMKDSILIVDDDKDYRNILSKYLSHDYVIYRAANGIDAIKLVREQNDIKVILSDLRMPEMDGIELLEQVQANNGNIATIFITGSSTVTSAVEAMRKGAYHYLQKPADLELLDLTIKNAMNDNNVAF